MLLIFITAASCVEQRRTPRHAEPWVSEPPVVGLWNWIGQPPTCLHLTVSQGQLYVTDALFTPLPEGGWW